MKRREFITLLGSSAVAWPLAARAQQDGRVRRVGVLMTTATDDPEGQARLAAFLQGLQQLGWIDGRNARIDTRWAGASAAEIRRHAAELPARWTALACEAVQERQAVTIKTAKGLLLQVMGDHAPEQVLAQSRRRLAAEDCLPAPPKRFGRKRADASDLGRDRGLLCHRLAHGYACG